MTFDFSHLAQGKLLHVCLRIDFSIEFKFGPYITFKLISAITSQNTTVVLSSTLIMQSWQEVQKLPIQVIVLRLFMTK